MKAQLYVKFILPIFVAVISLLSLHGVTYAATIEQPDYSLAVTQSEAAPTQVNAIIRLGQLATSTISNIIMNFDMPATTSASVNNTRIDLAIFYCDDAGYSSGCGFRAGADLATEPNYDKATGTSGFQTWNYTYSVVSGKYYYLQLTDRDTTLTQKMTMRGCSGCSVSGLSWSTSVGTFTGLTLPYISVNGTVPLPYPTCSVGGEDTCFYNLIPVDGTTTASTTVSVGMSLWRGNDQYPYGQMCVDLEKIDFTGSQQPRTFCKYSAVIGSDTFSTSTRLEQGTYQAMYYLYDPGSSTYNIDPIHALSTSTFFTVIQSQASYEQSILGLLGSSSAATSTNYCQALSENTNLLIGIGLMIQCLVQPQPQLMGQLIVSSRDLIMTKAPWGYITRFVQIMQNATSTPLPTISYTFSTSTALPLGIRGATWNLDPWPYFYATGSPLKDQIKSDRADSKNIWEIVEPFYNYVVLLTLAFMIFKDLTGSHGHDNHRQHL